MEESQPLVKMCRACNRAVGYKRDDYLCEECKKIKTAVKKYQDDRSNRMKKVEEGEKNDCLYCNGRGFRELAHPKESRSKVTIICTFCQPVPF